MATYPKTTSSNLTNINSKIGRTINRTIVLNSVRTHQPISRAEIAELTGLSKSTISSIVANLIMENLLAEDPSCNQEVGRNPIHLQIKKGTHVVGAIAIDAATTEAAIVDLDGSILDKREINTASHDPSDLVTVCVAAVKEMKSGFPGSVLKGIGAAIAGRVDAHRLRVVHSPMFGWENVDLGNLIRKNAPDIGGIAVENSANASMLAEMEFGTRRTAAGMVYLLVGESLEAGIVIGSDILSGSSYAAGDVGHMTIVDGGAPCGCGNRGCWNAYASDGATVSRYMDAARMQSPHLAGATMHGVVELAEKGDAAAIAAVTTTAHCIGRGIVNIMKLFDPEVIIVGGTIARCWDLISLPIMKTIDERGYFGGHQSTVLQATLLTGNPPLLGAAALSIRKIFSDYAVTD